MSKFSSITWSTLRNSFLGFRTSFLNNVRFSKYFKKKMPSTTCSTGIFMKFVGALLNVAKITPYSVVPLFFKAEKKSYKSTYDIEKEITDMVIKAEEMIIKNDLLGAKKILQEALKVAEETNVFGNISSVYDLLTTIALREGGVTEAEDMLANFIEKLLQLGYPEDHNSVIRFKLKLARVYQTIGNREMAELGYRDCINAQEEKLHKADSVDENTVLIYVNSLFWYGKLLTENGDFRKAKVYMKKTLSGMQNCSLIAPSQVMVVLYHNAEIAAVLKEYDSALDFLYKAIDLCNNKDQGNPDLPLYVVKVGEIFLLKGLSENAEFWCASANRLAKNFQNKDAEKDSATCLRKLEEMKSLKKKKSQ